MKDKKVFNVLKILNDIADMKVICMEEYANRLDVSVRTMYRYLKDISDFFSIKMIKRGNGCFQFVNFEKVREVLLNNDDFESFEKFANIINALNPKLLKYFNVDKDLLKEIVNNDLFLIKTSPFEEIMNFKLFNEIKKAIKYSHYISVEYQKYDEIITKFKNLRPYKIVFAEGNWYLVTHDNSELNGGVKFLRLNFIKNVKIYSRTFKKKKKILEYLENFQSLMSRFDKPKFEVIVFVDNEVERYFKVKKLLDSQQIIKDTKEGLILKYLINDEKEILFLAKDWLPHMKIISPSYLQDKLEEMINFNKNSK